MCGGSIQCLKEYLVYYVLTMNGVNSENVKRNQRKKRSKRGKQNLVVQQQDERPKAAVTGDLATGRLDCLIAISPCSKIPLYI